MSSVTIPANWDVSTLNQFIAQQESFLRGQLSAITSHGDVIVLEFDDQEGKPPERNTIVTTSAPPPGAKVVGSLHTFAGGKPALGIAFQT